MTVLDQVPDARPGAEQQRWVEAALAHTDEALLRELVAGMIDIPSPTGEEAPLARWLAGRMTELGLAGEYQPLDDQQGNAHGRVPGTGDGSTLLLYAPIDTLTVGTETEDVPWIGPALRPDMLPHAQHDGPFVSGLGASNPKGHGACVVAAAAAIHRAAIPLRGDLLVGLGAGGMPTNRRPVEHLRRYNAGQGAGCSFLLEQGTYPDYAVIAKPGWAVAWEEVGLCWFELTVRGTFSYVGSRHRMDYANPIVLAGVVGAELERWFAEYTARHTGGLVAPQGNIGAIRGGWPRMASVSPAAAIMTIDLRISPRTTPAQARREFGDFIARLKRTRPDITVSWDMVLSIPGTATSEDSWITRVAIEAWEHETGEPHRPIVANSGATDANILRARGVPTARIGMDRIGADAPIALDFPAGMNVVDLREMRRLTRHLIRLAINTCTRPIPASAAPRG